MTIFATDYQAAIGILDDEMYKIWGNDNWELLSCHTSPRVWTGGRPEFWEWEFKVAWHGLKN